MRRRLVVGWLARVYSHTQVFRVATAVLGLLLLTLAVASSLAAGHTAAEADLDHALQGQASSSASALTEYFERARSIDLLLANDTALRQFAPGSRSSALAPSRSRLEANMALQYLETLYPEAISEACLIDTTGTELARVVRGEIAPARELSSDEAANPFFAPTMRLPRGRVYQAEPYLSPDTGRWVISSSTPMATGTGATWGIVHFEVALDSFRGAALGLNRETGATTAIVDDRTGRILLETGRSLTADHLGRPSSPALTRLVRTSRAAGASATVDGQRVAVEHVPTQPDNANSWSIVVSAPAGAAGWSRSIGPAPVAIALAALALLAFAGLNLRSSHRQLRRASLTDELTGLPNRRLLTDRLTQSLLLGCRRDLISAVLLIDLDRFKEVNDTLGHQYGDQLLVEVASRLTNAVRTSDTVARLGGDEFAVLLPEVADENGALVLAERCIAALHDPFVVEGVTLSVEASIGIALAPRHGHDGNDVLRAADVAMYESKERRCIVVYNPGQDVHTPHRLALLGDLRRALQDDELVMYYQPKVDLETDAVRSAEALVRWRHPERGFLAPGEFIPVAESTGLILPLTLHTLDLAVRQAKQWAHDGQAIQVAVNLSPRCLLDVDLPARVQAILSRHGLPAHLLRLEVTETSVMIDPARALGILAALKQSGVALSLDDFGTGYSSMSYLKLLPVDELKIDRSFVTDMLAAGNDSILVRSSIDLGHNLGLSVVAEGVEDSTTLDHLAQLGCDSAQGYHLARPMTPEALTTWLITRPHHDATGPDPGRGSIRLTV